MKVNIIKKHNILKQCLCILTALTLMTSSVSLVISADYNGHWASESINRLIAAGVISGDGNGNIRPDDKLLRAEFVKVVNRVFGYVNTADENFNDVDSNKWYARDFLIAKGNRYIIGDQNKNAHPENFISRNEICVILSRILNLPTGGELTFKDKGQLPDWAAIHVSSLVASGYISGYEDATFRGEAYALRAEAFHILKRIMDDGSSEKDEFNKTEIAKGDSTGDVSGMTAYPSSTSLGGGNGGGSQTPSSPSTTASTPDINALTTGTDVLSWKGIPNAESYEIKLVFKGIETIITVSGQQTNYNLSEEFIKIFKNTPDSEIEISISIRAKNSDGSVSAYSSAIVRKASFTSLDAPEAEYIAGTANNKRIAKIIWDEVTGASGYNVEYFIDGVQITDSNIFVIDSPSRVAWIKDLAGAESAAEAYVQIEAISSNTMEYKNSPHKIVNVTLPEWEDFNADPDAPPAKTGDGSPENPYTIATGADFKTISEDPAAHYKLIRSIVLPSDYTPISGFGGTLKSDGGYRVIDVGTVINNPGTNAGLFSTLGDGVHIEGIILKGTVKNTSADQTGGFAGGLSDATITGSIVNCINMATIQGRASTGGIVGRPNSPGFKIEGCVNFGTISGTNNIGGIAGFPNGTQIVNCQNHGTITSTGVNVGGIAGGLYTLIEKCFNTASISTSSTSANSSVGGLAGITGTPVDMHTGVIDSYNTGAVTGTNTVGGIVGRVNSNVEISNCYNIGTALNACYTRTTGTITEKNILYLTGSGAGIGDAIPISSADYFADPNNAALVEEMKERDFIFDEPGYPLLKNNLPKAISDYYDYNRVDNLNAVMSGGSLDISWTEPSNPNIQDIRITIINNSKLETVVDELPVSGGTYTVSNPESGCYYGIKVTVYYKDGGISATVKKEALAS